MNLKELERHLELPLGNWIRWASQRNYLPQQPNCTLGRLMVRDEDDKLDEMHPETAPPPDESDAEDMEAAILSLPAREKQAFLLHHLNRGHRHGVTIWIKERSAKANLMGVGTRQYHYLVQLAHKRILKRLYPNRTF